MDESNAKMSAMLGNFDFDDVSEEGENANEVSQTVGHVGSSVSPKSSTRKRKKVASSASPRDHPDEASAINSSDRSNLRREADVDEDEDVLDEDVSTSAPAKVSMSTSAKSKNDKLQSTTEKKGSKVGTSSKKFGHSLHVGEAGMSVKKKRSSLRPPGG